MDKETSSLVNPWDIIDTFFRDTEYYKSQHQIDSFDEFIFSKDNGLQNIIKRENPFILYKGGSGEKENFDYEIRIFFGETFDDDGEIIPNVENIFIPSPSIFDNEDLKFMYPNDARLKNLTYKTSILCNIAVQYTFNKKGGKKIFKNFEKVNIGSIPIMIHSKSCLLHKLDSIKLIK